jgi:hypothetical protein
MRKPRKNWIEVVGLSIKEARAKFGPGVTGKTMAEMHMA